MKLLAFFVTLAVCVHVLALPPIENTRFRLNNGAVTYKPDQLGTQLVTNKIQSLKCIYDYARQGGVVSNINLQSVDGAPCTLPNKAIILRTWFDIVTAFQSSTSAATIMLSTGVSAGDIKLSVASSTLSGVNDGIQNWTAALAIKLSAARVPFIGISTTTMTAGKVVVFIEYVISD